VKWKLLLFFFSKEHLLRKVPTRRTTNDENESTITKFWIIVCFVLLIVISNSIVKLCITYVQKDSTKCYTPIIQKSPSSLHTILNIIHLTMFRTSGHLKGSRPRDWMRLNIIIMLARRYTMMSLFKTPSVTAVWAVWNRNNLQRAILRNITGGWRRNSYVLGLG